MQDHLSLTAAERVAAVGDCVMATRKAQGKVGLPRFRRVYRLLER